MVESPNGEMFMGRPANLLMVLSMLFNGLTNETNMAMTDMKY